MDFKTIDQINKCAYKKLETKTRKVKKQLILSHRIVNFLFNCLLSNIKFQFTYFVWFLIIVQTVLFLDSGSTSFDLSKNNTTIKHMFNGTSVVTEAGKTILFPSFFAIEKHLFIFKEYTKLIKNADLTTGCCIDKISKYCIQTTNSNCPGYQKLWISEKNSLGPYCGGSQKYFDDWPNNPTRNNVSISVEDEYMYCDIKARPCIVYDKCIYTVKEECDFFQGDYYENEFICELALRKNGFPRFFKIITNMFYCFGLWHFIISLLIEYFYVKPLEEKYGTIQMIQIFITCMMLNCITIIIDIGVYFIGITSFHCFVLCYYYYSNLDNPRASNIIIINIIVLLYIIPIPYMNYYATALSFMMAWIYSYHSILVKNDTTIQNHLSKILWLNRIIHINNAIMAIQIILKVSSYVKNGISIDIQKYVEIESAILPFSHYSTFGY